MQTRSPQPSSAPPVLARMLGYAGLLPQAAVVTVLAFGSTRCHAVALSLGFAYAALILSFLGGIWWGFAASRSDRSPTWIWPAAVAPSLIAFATALLLAVGATSLRSSLMVLGVSLFVSLLVDRRLVTDGLAPGWWMTLRVPLSVGLGVLTLATAVII